MLPVDHRKTKSLPEDNSHNYDVATRQQSQLWCYRKTTATTMMLPEDNSHNYDVARKQQPQLRCCQKTTSTTMMLPDNNSQTKMLPEDNSHNYDVARRQQSQLWCCQKTTAATQATETDNDNHHRYHHPLQDEEDKGKHHGCVGAVVLARNVRHVISPRGPGREHYDWPPNKDPYVGNGQERRYEFEKIKPTGLTTAYPAIQQCRPLRQSKEQDETVDQ